MLDTDNPTKLAETLGIRLDIWPTSAFRNGRLGDTWAMGSRGRCYYGGGRGPCLALRKQRVGRFRTKIAFISPSLCLSVDGEIIGTWIYVLDVTTGLVIVT